MQSASISSARTNAGTASQVVVLTAAGERPATDTIENTALRKLLWAAVWSPMILGDATRTTATPAKLDVKISAQLCAYPLLASKYIVHKLCAAKCKHNEAGMAGECCGVFRGRAFTMCV